MHYVRIGSAHLFLGGMLIAVFVESRVGRVYGIGIVGVSALLFASAVPWRSIWSRFDAADLFSHVMSWRWTRETFIILALLLGFGVFPAVMAPSTADAAMAILGSITVGLLFITLINWHSIRSRMRGMREVTSEIPRLEKRDHC